MVDIMASKPTTNPIYHIYKILKIFGDNDIVREAEVLQTEDTITIKGYTYMKLKIQTSSNGQDLSVYQNIGTDRTLVVQIFLSHFSNVKIIKTTILTRIANYLGPVTKL